MMRRVRIGIGTIVILLLAAGGSVNRLQAQANGGVSAETKARFLEAWAKAPRVDVGVPADGAKVVVLKFNDYECPGCRTAEALYAPVLERLASAHPGAVKYVVKDWPWNADCNFNVARTLPGHEASCDAAVAARVARERGTPAPMIDWLYANQGATRWAVRAAATRLLGITDFDREAGLKLPAIRGDIAEGGAIGIDSTPTYFINGVRLPGSTLPPELFELAIAEELNPAAR